MFHALLDEGLGDPPLFDPIDWGSMPPPTPTETLPMPVFSLPPPPPPPVISRPLPPILPSMPFYGIDPRSHNSQPCCATAAAEDERWFRSEQVAQVGDRSRLGSGWDGGGNSVGEARPQARAGLSSRLLSDSGWAGGLSTSRGWRICCHSIRLHDTAR